MSEIALYYLFSTTAQAYAAIVGVIGLLVVYRLEGLSRVRGTIRQRLVDPPRDYLHSVLKVQPYGWSAEDISYHVNKMLEEDEQALSDLKKNKADYGYLMSEVIRIENSIILGTRIRDHFKSFMKFHLPLIIIPIFLIQLVPLPFSFLESHQMIVHPLIFIIVLILLSGALIRSYKLIWSMAVALLDER